MWESDWDILGVGKSSINGGMGETPKIPHGYANLVNGAFRNFVSNNIELTNLFSIENVVFYWGIG